MNLREAKALLAYLMQNSPYASELDLENTGGGVYVVTRSTDAGHVVYYADGLFLDGVTELTYHKHDWYDGDAEPCVVRVINDPSEF